MTAEPMCYFARRPACGHIVAVTVDMPDDRRAVAAFLSDCVRRGLTIERTSVVAFKQLRDWCDDDCPNARERRRRTTQLSIESFATQGEAA